MSQMRRFEIYIPAELDEALEAGRGFEKKGAFARRVLMGALGVDDGAVPVPARAEAVAGRVEAEQAVRSVPAAPVTSPRAAGGARVHGSPALERFGGKS